MMGEAVVLLLFDLLIAGGWADSWALMPLARSVGSEAFPKQKLMWDLAV